MNNPSRRSTAQKRNARRTRRVMSAGWLPVLAVALALGVSSCAAMESTEGPDHLAIAGWSGEDEIEALLEADAEVREALSLSNEAFQEASRAARQAAALADEEELPPDLERRSDEEIRRLRAEAESHRQRYFDLRQDLEERYEAFIDRHPNNWLARHRFAWFLADYGQYVLAAEQWREVIALRADFAFAYNNLGTVYNHMGRDMEALDLYRKAISLKDDEPEFHFNLGNVYATHRTDVADKFGWDLPRVFRESLDAFRRARELDPGNFDYAQAIASQFIMAHHFEVEDWADEAIEEWEYCLDLDLTPVQRSLVLTNLATIHLRQKRDPATAREILLEAKEVHHTPRVETLLEHVDEMEAQHRL